MRELRESLMYDEGWISMDNQKNEIGSKKPYDAPKLTTISLRPEEAVLGHCKTSGSSFPGFPCTAFVCSNVGS